MSARPRGPQPSGPRAPGPREKTCCWSASSWLHLLRSWSLRSTRGGSRGQSVDFLCKQYFPVLFPSLGSVVFVDSASATAEKDVEEWVTTRRAVACPASPAARDRRSRG